MTAPTLSTLLDRIKQAGGQLPDDLLGEVICAVHGEKFLESAIYCGDDGSDEFEVWAGADVEQGKCVHREYRHRCPDVSLDAALALVQARLPGWHWIMQSIGAPHSRYEGELVRGEDGESVAEEAPTPALALLASLLAALIAEGVG